MTGRLTRYTMEFTMLSNDNQNRIMRLREAAWDGLKICTERGRLLTESFKQTEAYPPLFRKVAALEHMLDNKRIKIWDDELIVGSISARRLGLVMMPEVNASWFSECLKAMTEIPDADEDTRQDRDAMTEMTEYWSGKCLYSRWLSEVPEEAKDIVGVLIDGMSYA